MSYAFTITSPFGGTGGQQSGGPKNKGILLTNTTSSPVVVDLRTYSPTGSTAGYVQVHIVGNRSEIFDLRVWGVSCGSGVTGAILS